MTRTLSVRVELEVEEDDQEVSLIADRLGRLAAVILDGQPEVTKILHAGYVVRKQRHAVTSPSTT